MKKIIQHLHGSCEENSACEQRQNSRSGKIFAVISRVFAGGKRQCGESLRE